MLTSQYLSEKFSAGLAYGDYVRTGTTEQQTRWRQIYSAAAVAPEQAKLVGAFVREMNVLVLSGIWCGDCVQQCPLVERLAEASAGKVRVRFVDRDEQKELAERFRINGGMRVPVGLFLSEDFELCSAFGDRGLHRYRALAAKQLGASCPIAVAPPDPNETASSMQDWLDEFERVHLMLRLSPRLRQRHHD